MAEQRKLTRTQVLLLQSLWTPVERPHHSNNHAPWPHTCQATYVLCGQNASLQLPNDQIRPLLKALQTRLRIESSNPELAINEILASHADPNYYEWQKVVMENTSWQLNRTDTGYLDVQCTGLGGGELDKDWEVLLACRKEAHVYGPSLSKQDDWRERAGTIAGTAHTQEYLLLHLAMFPMASTPGAMSLECLMPTSCKLKSSFAQRRCWSIAPLPQRIGNHHGRDTCRAYDSSPNCWLPTHW